MFKDYRDNYKKHNKKVMGISEVKERKRRNIE